MFSSNHTTLLQKNKKEINSRLYKIRSCKFSLIERNIEKIKDYIDLIMYKRVKYKL